MCLFGTSLFVNISVINEFLELLCCRMVNGNHTEMECSMAVNCNRTYRWFVQQLGLEIVAVITSMLHGELKHIYGIEEYIE